MDTNLKKILDELPEKPPRVVAERDAGIATQTATLRQSLTWGRYIFRYSRLFSTS